MGFQANADAGAPPLAQGSAPAKLILMGEHAVVHGFPAVALPVPALAATVVAWQTPGPLRLHSPVFTGPIAEAAAVPAAARGLAAAARQALAMLGRPADGLTLEVRSEVPMGAGLGSSAAVAVALVRAIYAACGRTPSEEALLVLAHRAETEAHGTPSGVDSHTSALGRPICYVQGQGARRLALPRPLYLVVADSGRPGHTGEAVQAVAARLRSEPTATRDRLERLGQLAEAVVRALESGVVEAAGPLFDAAHGELAELGVSDAGLDRLVAAARLAGARGAKLTGGGRGGCIVALAADAAEQERLVSALTAAGAARVWRVTQPPVEKADS
ncbi:MAG: mevalonate kinase [Candidatus Sericytochromatia bacterium]